MGCETTKGYNPNYTVVEGNHAPIIDEDTFNRVQDRLKIRSKQLHSKTVPRKGSATTLVQTLDVKEQVCAMQTVFERLKQKNLY